MAWPAILTFGFRPLFMGAAVWAVLSTVLWVPMLSGGITLPTAFDPVSWYAHGFLFGYLAAVAAGFLLTAVPNWTGRLPLVGWLLGGLFPLWVAGQLAVMFSSALRPAVVAVIDLAMPVALGLSAGIMMIAVIGGALFPPLPATGLPSRARGGCPSRRCRAIIKCHCWSCWRR